MTTGETRALGIEERQANATGGYGTNNHTGTHTNIKGIGTTRCSTRSRCRRTAAKSTTSAVFCLIPTPQSVILVTL